MIDSNLIRATELPKYFKLIYVQRNTNSVRPSPKLAKCVAKRFLLFHFQLRIGRTVTHTSDRRRFLGPSFEFLMRADFRIFRRSYSLSGN